jgi:flagellar biosynthetic protein FliP
MSSLRLVCLKLLSIAVLFGLGSARAQAQSASEVPTPFLNSNLTPSPTTQEIPWSSNSTTNDVLKNMTNPPGITGEPHPSGPGYPRARVGAPVNGIQITGLGNSSAPWTIVVLLTLLALIPSLMICVTPFARLLVVFHFLRQALGLQTTPSNQTLIGLSLVLTLFIMQPVGEQIYHDAVVPLETGKISAFDAVGRGSEPLRHFMAHYVREKDAALFLDIAHVPRPRTVDDIPMRVMMPAYIVSELRAGFQIGAVLFLPFLVVDIVVASITNAVGMMQLPPVVISTPLKLMLFLMVDGWHLLVGALVRSFN